MCKMFYVFFNCVLYDREKSHIAKINVKKFTETKNEDEKREIKFMSDKEKNKHSKKFYFHPCQLSFLCCKRESMQ